MNNAKMCSVKVQAALETLFFTFFLHKILPIITVNTTVNNLTYFYYFCYLMPFSKHAKGSVQYYNLGQKSRKSWF